jgi:hypothetical protein
MRVFKMEAMEVLSALLSIESAPSTQASAVWAIGTLCSGITEIQNSIRIGHDGQILRMVVELLDSKVPQVCCSADCVCLYVLPLCRFACCSVCICRCALQCGICIYCAALVYFFLSTCALCVLF